jgi:hypothetical protein
VNSAIVNGLNRLAQHFGKRDQAAQWLRRIELANLRPMGSEGFGSQRRALQGCAAARDEMGIISAGAGARRPACVCPPRSMIVTSGAAGVGQCRRQLLEDAQPHAPNQFSPPATASPPSR